MWITFSNQLQKAYNIRAKKGIVIQDECIRDGRNCICATMPEELMAEVVICVIAIRTCSPKRCQIHLSELQWEIYQEYADSEDQESEIVGMFIHLHKLGFVPPLVLQLPMQCLLLQSGTTRVSDLPRPAEYI